MKNICIIFISFFITAALAVAENPPATSGAASLFAKPNGTELSLVIVKPFSGRRSLNPDQIESLEKIGGRIDQELQKLTAKSIGQTANDLVSNLSRMQASSGLKAPLEALKESASEIITVLNADLPKDNALVYSAYLLPIANGGLPSPIPPVNSTTTFDPPRWETQNQQFMFAGFEIPSMLIEPQNSMGEAALSGRISESMRTALASFTPDSRFVIAAVAVHISLQKDKSEIKLQVLSGLKPATIPFTQENDQVSINQIVIPSPKEVRDNQVALLSLQAKLQGHDRSEAPKVKLEFGSLGGLDGGSYGNWRGSMKVERVFSWADGSTDNLCHERFREAGQNIIAIEGTLKQGAIANRFFRERFGSLFESLNPKARFRIFDLYLNVDNLAVEGLNVRVDVATDISFLQFGCMNQRDVREQFEGEFNNSIHELLGIKDSRGQQFAEQMFLAVYTI